MPTDHALPTPANRYGGHAIALHWLGALMIVGVFAVGLYMDDLPMSPAKFKLINYHKWAGVLVLALSVWRLVWRLTHRPPPSPPGPAWQTGVAHLTHWALYALFLAVPLVGWAYSSAAGRPIVLFGLLPLPDLVAKDQALAEVLKHRHGNLAWLMIGLVVLHVAAAVKHQLIDKDGLIGRMLPGRG